MKDKVELICMYLLFILGLYAGWNKQYDQAAYAVACACFIRIGIER